MIEYEFFLLQGICLKHNLNTYTRILIMFHDSVLKKTKFNIFLYRLKKKIKDPLQNLLNTLIKYLGKNWKMTLYGRIYS